LFIGLWAASSIRQDRRWRTADASVSNLESGLKIGGTSYSLSIENRTSKRCNWFLMLQIINIASLSNRSMGNHYNRNCHRLESHLELLYDKFLVPGYQVFLLTTFVLSIDFQVVGETVAGSIIKHKFVLLFSLSWFLVTSSCSAPQLPIEISDASASRPPTVGKLVDLLLEVRSIGAEPDVLLTLSFPQMIYSPIEKPQWHLDLQDNKPQTISTEICVLEEGSWLVDVSVASYFDDGEFKYGDRRVLQIISTEDSAKVLLEKDITYSQAEETQKAQITPVKVAPSDCVMP